MSEDELKRAIEAKTLKVKREEDKKIKIERNIKNSNDCFNILNGKFTDKSGGAVNLEGFVKYANDEYAVMVLGFKCKVGLIRDTISSWTDVDGDSWHSSHGDGFSEISRTTYHKKFGIIDKTPCVILFKSIRMTNGSSVPEQNTYSIDRRYDSDGDFINELMAHCARYLV